jgi:DnaJ-class molecular chaperone
MEPARAKKPGGFASAMAAAVSAPPGTAAGPALKACVKCAGTGRSHDSSMPHSGDGCIFCKECSGCEGSGVISATAIACPKCQGKGKSHDSSMPHSAGCIFCKTCKTCEGKGHVG